VSPGTVAFSRGGVAAEHIERKKKSRCHDVKENVTIRGQGGCQGKHVVEVATRINVVDAEGRGEKSTFSSGQEIQAQEECL